MGKSVYSFGVDSPLKFTISDRLAKRYNEALQEFFKAQQRFNQKFGRQWDPTKDPIRIQWTAPQAKAWNEFGKIFNKTLAEFGPFHENDLMEDFLVKNAPKPTDKTKTQAKVITLALIIGTLYGFLRGRKYYE